MQKTRADAAPRILPTTILAFLVALGLGALFGVSLPGFGHMHSDAADYLTEALRLVGASPRLKAFYWPPGTALVVSTIFRLTGEANPTLGSIISLVFVAADVALIVVLSAMLMGRRVFVFAGWLAALYPTFFLMATQTSSHIFELFWILSTAIFSILGARSRRWRWFALAGAALGMAALTRPSAGLFGLFVPATVLLTHEHPPGSSVSNSLKDAVFAGLVALALAAVVLAPVLEYNHANHAGWAISTNNERNFFLGNNPYTPLYQTWHFASRPVNALPPKVAEYLQSLYNAPQPRHAMVQAALSEIEGHPGRFLLRTFNRACAFWGPDYEMSRQLQIFLRLRTWVAALLFGAQILGFWVVGLLTIFATCCNSAIPIGRSRLLLWTGVALLQLPYVVAFAEPLYHFEALGLLMPLAAIGLCEARDRFRSGHLRQLVLPAEVPRLATGLVIFLALQIEFLVLVRGP